MFRILSLLFFFSVCVQSQSIALPSQTTQLSIPTEHQQAYEDGKKGRLDTFLDLIEEIDELKESPIIDAYLVGIAEGGHYQEFSKAYFGKGKFNPLRILSICVRNGYTQSFKAFYSHVILEEEGKESETPPADGSWPLPEWTPLYLIKMAYEEGQNGVIDYFWSDEAAELFKKSDLFLAAAKYGDYDRLIRSLDQIASDDTLRDDRFWGIALIYAFALDRQDVADSLMKLHAYPTDEVAYFAARSGNIGAYLEAMKNVGDIDLKVLLKRAIAGSNLEIIEHVLACGATLSEIEDIRSLLCSGDLAMIRLALENIDDVDSHIFIALSNSYGPYSGGFRNWNPQLEEGKQVFLIGLSEEVFNDPTIMSLVSGIVNPGTHDTFPWNSAPFGLEDILTSPARKFKDNNTLDVIKTEQFYQRVIDYAEQHHIPYLGLCGGSQHLILHQGGFLQRVDNHTGRNAQVTLFKGSIIHYLAMTEEEKKRFHESGILPDIMIDEAKVEHNFAGVEDLLGNDIELGGVSEENVPEIFSKGLWMIGTQFHPESLYNDETHAINRNKELLDSYLSLCKTYRRLKKDNEQHHGSEEDLFEKMNAIESSLKASLQQREPALQH